MASTLRVDKDNTAQVSGWGTRTLTIKPQAIPGGSTTARGYLQVKPAVAVDTNDAKFGDIIVEVSGDNVDSTDVKVATYADYAVTVKIDGDAKELTAGRDNSDKDDQKLAKLHIKEGVKASITPNRKTKIEFPSWVKITDVKVSDATGIDGSALETELKGLIAA
ncbi:hypothetical protein U6K67_12210, partial [Cutibacterium acnes]